MAFLLNKMTIITVIVLVFLFLIWKVNNIKDQLKQAKEDLEIYKQTEDLRKKAYQQYRERISDLENKMSVLKEKYNVAEKDEASVIWLENDIPLAIDNSIPY